MAESPVEQNTFSLNFSYVCPEPGLVKSSLCVQNGLDKVVFRTRRPVRDRASEQHLFGVLLQDC